MPSTATTNITIGSLLDLLAPAAAPSNDGGGDTAFDSLLQPPSPPAASPATTSQSDPPPPSKLPRSAESSQRPPASAPPPSSTSSGQDQQSSEEHAAVEAAEKSPQSKAPSPAENKAPHNPSEESDQTLVAASLAAATLTTASVPLPGLPKADEAPAEVASTDGINPSAGKQAISKATSLKAGKSATAAPESDKVNSATAPSPAGQEQSSEHPAHSRTAKSAAEAAADADAFKQNASQAEAAHDSPTVVPGAAPQAADPSSEVAISQLSAADGTDAKSVDRRDTPQDQAANPLASISTAAALAATDPTSPANRSTVAAAVPVPVSGPAANQPAPSSPGNSASAPSGIPPAAGRTRSPLTSIAEGNGDVRRGSRVEVDTTRLLSRVARAFQAAQERDGELRLRLSPPELGSLRLSVHVQDGALVAKLETENAAAKTALLDNLPALKERLAEQGVRIERFDVDLMQHQSGGTPDRPQEQERNVPQPARPALSSRPRSDSSSTPRPAASGIDPAGRLNVII